MSLETHISGAEDRLLDSLHFGGKNSASYIIDRRQVTFAPSSASSWKPSGVRLCRFNLADQSGWLDGKTVRLFFTLTNLDTNALVPTCDSPASMFRRVRIIANGSTVIEDIEDHGRLYEMFSYLLPANRRMGNIGETWGGSSTTPTLNHLTPVPSIAAGASRQVGCSFISPFLNQGKYLPLHMMPITIELELDDGDMAFQGAGTVWEITRPRLVGDVCQLDQALANSYAQHLLQGKSLPFYCDGLYTIRTAVTSASRFSFPIARGFTRLSAIYLTMFNNSGSWITNMYNPSEGVANSTAIDDFNWNITIGADKFPIFDCESTQESYYRLRLCEQTHGGRDSFGITPFEYFTNTFIVGQSLEKASGSAHTGLNTRSGSQLTVNLKNLNNAVTLCVVLKYEQIVSLSAAGTQVLD